jgi:antirestriction protein ArdC
MSKLDQRLVDMAKALNLRVVLSKDVVHGSYTPCINTIALNPNVTYNTLNAIFAHELIHATGHPDYLKRPIISTLVNIGCLYPTIETTLQRRNEEVIAEYGAMLLCDMFGIDYDKVAMSKYILSHLDSDEMFNDTTRDAKNAVKFLIDLERKAVS